MSSVIVVSRDIATAGMCYVRKARKKNWGKSFSTLTLLLGQC